MFRKFNKVLIITLLAISLAVALGNEAESALKPYLKGINCYENPGVCFDCLFKGTGSAIQNGTVLYFEVAEITAVIYCNNGGDQNVTGIGVPHSFTVSFGISGELEEAERNGTWEIELCYEEADFDARIAEQLTILDGSDEICNQNPQWYWNQAEGWDFTEYIAELILEMENEERWYLKLRVWPDGEGCYNYEILEERLVSH